MALTRIDLVFLASRMKMRVYIIPFLKIKYKWQIIFFLFSYMNLHYDSRELIIIKRIKQESMSKQQNSKSFSNTKFNPLRSLQTQYLDQQTQEIIPEVEKPRNLGERIKQIKVRQHLLLFISNLKRNSSNIKAPLNYWEPSIKFHQEEIKKDIKGFYLNAKLRLIIDLLTLLSIIFIHVFATFQMFFQDFRNIYQSQIWYEVLQCVVLGVICIRIVCGFTVQVEDKGIKIQYLNQITKFYLKSSNFWLDLALLISILSMICFPTLPYPGAIGYFFSLANLIALKRVQYIITLQLLNKSRKQYYRILKLFLGNFFVSHFTGTLLLGITYLNSQNWMDKYGISQQTWLDKYIAAVYWAAYIIFAIGFGDISVHNGNEAVLVLIIFLTGRLTLAYNVSEMDKIMCELRKINNEVQKQLTALRKITINTSISKNLHHSMLEYIIYASEIKQSFEIIQTNDLISMLPEKMRNDFLLQSSNNFFRDMPYFCYLSTKTKIQLSDKMSQQIAVPGEYLTQKCFKLLKIYIMRKGKIGLAYRKKGAKLNGTILEQIRIQSESNPPQLLNKYLLVRGRSINYDIISQGYTTVSVLTFQELHQCMKENSHDLQFFSQFMDSANIGEEECNRTPCQNCSINHSIFVCPRLHYMPIRSFIFLKSQKSKQTDIQEHLPFHFNRIRQKLRRDYNLKMWKGVFKRIQDVLSVNSKKKLIISMKRTRNYDPTESERQKQVNYMNNPLKGKNRANKFEVDQIHDFNHYFTNSNPQKIAAFPLTLKNI